MFLENFFIFYLYNIFFFLFIYNYYYYYIIYQCVNEIFGAHFLVIISIYFSYSKYIILQRMYKQCLICKILMEKGGGLCPPPLRGGDQPAVVVAPPPSPSPSPAPAPSPSPPPPHKKKKKGGGKGGDGGGGRYEFDFLRYKIEKYKIENSSGQLETCSNRSERIVTCFDRL